MWLPRVIRGNHGTPSEPVYSVIKPRAVNMTMFIDGDPVHLGAIMSDPKFMRITRVTRYDVLMRDD